MQYSSLATMQISTSKPTHRINLQYFVFSCWIHICSIGLSFPLVEFAMQFIGNRTYFLETERYASAILVSSDVNRFQNTTTNLTTFDNMCQDPNRFRMEKRGNLSFMAVEMVQTTKVWNRCVNGVIPHGQDPSWTESYKSAVCVSKYWTAEFAWPQPKTNLSELYTDHHVRALSSSSSVLKFHDGLCRWIPNSSAMDIAYRVKCQRSSLWLQDAELSIHIVTSKTSWRPGKSWGWSLNAPK